MLRFEWKKLLYYRKGLALILVFLIAELAGILLFTKPYDRELEANRAVYDTYLSRVEGPLTPENRQWLEDEMLRLNTANMKLEKLKTDYYAGRVSEEDFRSQFDVLAAENADYPGFSKLYTQYIYVRETDQRYFLYTGGWEVLFGNQDPDYLFLLLLVFLIAPIFCQEYGNQMDQILLTQRKSAKYQWQIKVGVALLLTFVLTALLQAFELGYCAIRFGLPHWDYSLQSLYSFGGAKKEMQLWQAFLLQFALKELGYLYATLFILNVSVLVKKYAFTLMAGIVTLPIPFLTVNSHAVLRQIPAPWALTIGSIYLNGDGLRISGGEAVPVPEMTWNQLQQVVAFSILICLMMLMCIRHKNANYHVRRRTPKAVAAVLAVMLLCTGCGSQEVEKIYYNANRSGCFESERYILFSNDLDSIYFIDKQTGKSHDFPMDAFRGETATAKGSFYYKDGELYYLKAEQQAPNGNSEGLSDHYALVALDIATMEERVVYRWSDSNKWFFGLLDKESTEPNTFSLNTFFLHGNKMFYLVNSELYAMDLQNGTYELFMELPNSSANVAYDGENLYYTDQYNRLVMHELSSGAVMPMEKVVARKFVWTPEGIYFLNIRDNNSLYYWNEATQTAEKLDDTSAYDLYWDEKYCWIDSSEGLYRINHDGSNKTKVECPGYVSCITTGEGMYMVDYNVEDFSEILYCVNKDTLEWESVSYT